MDNIQKSAILNSYKRCHSRCCHALSQSPLATNYGVELYPLLYAILCFTIPDFSNNRYCIDSVDEYVTGTLNADDYKTFNRRIDFYRSVAAGTVIPRGDWILVDPDVSNPLICMLIAFGDIVTNPACGDDYKSAPVLVASIFDLRKISKAIVDDVKHIITDELTVLLDNPLVDQSPRKAATAAANSERPVYKAGSFVSSFREMFSCMLRALFVACLGICIVGYALNSFLPRAYDHSPTEKKTSVASQSPYVYAVANDLTPISTPVPTPVFTADPLPLPYTGKEFLSPGYVRVCPLTITASTNSSYYIYLQYGCAPTESYDSRHVSGYGEGEDLSFFIRAGETVELDVPVGVYRFYYATGDTWYGIEYKFGPNTAYFTSDDLLTFYTTHSTIYGNTLELWAQYNGNFETETIAASSFPG